MSKICSKCKKEFPATREYFHTNNQTKDKLSRMCKWCKRVMDSERNRKSRSMCKGKQKSYNYGVCPHNMNGLGSMTPDVEKLYVDFVNRLGIERSMVTDPRLSISTNEVSFNLLHASMGLVTEAAEVIDLIKKHLAYNRDFDRQKILSEISDIWFYATMVLIDQKSSYKEIIDLNMAKLKARYPDGYNHQSANNRNLELEEKMIAQSMITNTDYEGVAKQNEERKRT